MSRTLPDLLADAARRAPSAVALRHGEASVTYRDLAGAVDRLAGVIHALGLGGRRIGILLPNVAAFPLAWFAVHRAGCSALLLNPLNSPREVREYCADAGVTDLLTAEALLPLLPAGARALLVDGLPAALRVRGPEGEAEHPLAAATPPAPPAPRPDDEAAVLYTAANRGYARGAVLSHRNLASNAAATVDAMGIGEGDRMLAALPLIHAFGLTVSLNATVLAGGTLLPLERFHPLRVLELLAQEGVTVFAGVPAMYQGLIGAAERRGARAHSLRLAICGGAPLEAEVGRRWEELFGLPLRQGYGLTEAGPVCLFNRLDRPNRPGTLGYPFPGVEVSVRGPEGSPLPAGEVGELCVRGDNVFHGYLGDDGRSGRDFHQDWLRTGDLASEEPAGAIRFRGVLKPMFTRNGFNIYPAELERVLEADGRVARASVCSQPNPARENDIVLFVRPAAGAALTEDDVRELCRATLAAYKQPTRVEIESPES